MSSPAGDPQMAAKNVSSSPEKVAHKGARAQATDRPPQHSKAGPPARKPEPFLPSLGPAAPAGPGATTATIVMAVAIVTGLTWGRDVLIPLALAILLSFILGPVVTRVRRLGVPRLPAVVLVITLALALIAGFALLLTNQAIDLAVNLPNYGNNLQAKLQVLGTPGRLLERAGSLFQHVSQAIESAASPSGTAPAPPGAETPVLVRVQEPPASPFVAAGEIIVILLSPLATAGLVLLFVVFFLVQREDLRDRMIRLFGARDVHRTTLAMNDAAKRLSRYLLMQLIINLSFGATFGFGLMLLGVPNFFLWGLLGAVLRFVPYVGSLTAAVFPFLLAVAVDPGWGTPLLVLALFLGIELVLANFLEPWLLGSSTGLSPVAVIVAAVFWTILWGPLGLLLATPLTACLVVLGRHVPRLEFLAILLGNEAPLAPAVKFYQRLLADDVREAGEFAEAWLDERPRHRRGSGTGADLEENPQPPAPRSLAGLFDEVMVPALIMADQDHHRGALNRDRTRIIADHVAALALTAAEEAEPDELPAIPQAPSTAADGREATAEPGPEPKPESGDRGPPVLCFGGRSTLDEVAAAMLGHVLRYAGWTVVTASPEAAEERPGVLCLVTVDPAAVRQLQRLLRRLRGRLGPGLPVVVALLGAASRDLLEAGAALTDATLVTSLAEAAETAATLGRAGDTVSGPKPALPEPGSTENAALPTPA